MGTEMNGGVVGVGVGVGCTVTGTVGIVVGGGGDVAFAVTGAVEPPPLSAYTAATPAPAPARPGSRHSRAHPSSRWRCTAGAGT